MNRRTVLAALASGSGAGAAGCLTDGDDPDDPGENSTDDPPTEGVSGETCGPASESLADRLTDEPGDGESCPSDPEVSLAVENAREEKAAVAVTVNTPGGEDDPALDERYDLDPGEHVVESSGVPTTGDVTVTVSSDDGTEDEWTASWDERSCKRHGIVIDRDGIEVGYVDPLSGPVDTQHDCYAGDGAPIRVANRGQARTVSIIVDDRCSGDRTEAELDIDADDVETVNDALVNGGIFEVTVDPEDGTSDTYDFDEECWGLSVEITDDGAVEIRRTEID
ncbi:hypothetical protein Halru_2495 [Halovivax ruber XH-70]|uniref:Ig-like domain-containing protein n=1 Tax=Halovivax ruber (strain DSM 18193 / JCM 13892 / XH-70) TaxID=797302 RepID=L0IGG1_HALRX|nr:hypothetical protein [Halovivax ruber]AGB17077.1 hypothetical protein Halru_2495 [Halovivax ruber XH-70]